MNSALSQYPEQETAVALRYVVLTCCGLPSQGVSGVARYTKHSYLQSILTYDSPAYCPLNFAYFPLSESRPAFSVRTATAFLQASRKVFLGLFVARPATRSVYHSSQPMKQHRHVAWKEHGERAIPEVVPHARFSRRRFSRTWLTKQA